MKKHNKASAPKQGIAETLSHIRHYLPSQGPIKDFIHHNTLHMFQDHNLSFHEAIRKASSLYGAREYLPLSEYRAAFKAGKISERALALALKQEGGDTPALREKMLHADMQDTLNRASFREQGYLSQIVRTSGLVLEDP